MIKNIEKALAKYWGYDDFLPLQKQAMECISSGQDVIAVMPTGGGKSLCFQAPAVTMPGLAVVVSPLISLMKDQVDTLTELSVPAARIDSFQSVSEQETVIAQIHNKTLKILYLAPERLVSPSFLEILKNIKLSFVAIDEAHCISIWGHDFRPEYRQLKILKKTFPDITIGAYTATATEQVRKDIAQQLQLENPKELIGSFDRPNLIYRVQRRMDILEQVRAVLDQHKRESGIIYCIRRKDVEDLCAALNSKGYNTAPYHAGMEEEWRKSNQEAFIREKINAIVATIAFGMGIDKSNVRYVIHTGMPKSFEYYQQESGRAGRDGLEAESYLFYSSKDYGIWKKLMRNMEPEVHKIAMAKLSKMHNYCSGIICRHRAILRYFGQDYDKNNCAACDICLGEIDCIDDALDTAKKILSCIVHLDEGFSSGYTASVLVGLYEKRIVRNNHDKLSTFGLLSDYAKYIVHDWIEQLVGQEYIKKIGEYHILKLTDKGWQVLRGKEKPRLLKPTYEPIKVPEDMMNSWEGIDKGLFEELHNLRETIASKKRVPVYIVFDDSILHDIARRRPSTPETLLKIKRVGKKRCEQYSEVVLAVIKNYCLENGLEMDI